MSMRISPFEFREFDAGSAAATLSRPTIGQFLPGGRQKEEAPPPPPPPPSFSEEDMHAAKQEAYRKGFDDGVREGHAQAQNEQAEIDRQINAHIERFASAVGPLLADYHRFVLEARQTTPSLALAISRKITADVLSEQACALVEAVTRQCCQAMLGEPKLKVTVPAGWKPTLEAKLMQLAASQSPAADMVVCADEALAPTDCRVEWQHGFMERNTEKLQALVEKTIADMVASADYTTQLHIDSVSATLAIAPETVAKE